MDGITGSNNVHAERLRHMTSTGKADVSENCEFK